MKVSPDEGAVDRRENKDAEGRRMGFILAPLMSKELSLTDGLIIAGPLEGLLGF